MVKNAEFIGKSLEGFEEGDIFELYFYCRRITLAVLWMTNLIKIQVREGMVGEMRGR